MASSNRTFEFLKKVQAQCVDFTEFDQTVYIKDGLHGSLVTKSVFEEGVCAALCAYVLADWHNNGTSRKKPVDQLCMDCNELNSVRPSLETVFEIAQKLDEPKSDPRIEFISEVKKLTKGSGVPIKDSNFQITPVETIIETISMGASFIAMGGIISDGHAILCDGKNRIIFDPNYGYFQTKNTDEYYSLVFGKLLANYPGYSQNVGAMTIYQYK